MAGQPLEAVLLVGLGFRALSMAPSAIPRVKEALRAVRAADARVARRALPVARDVRRDRGAGQGGAGRPADRSARAWHGGAAEAARRRSSVAGGLAQGGGDRRDLGQDRVLEGRVVAHEGVERARRAGPARRGARTARPRCGPRSRRRSPRRGCPRGPRPARPVLRTLAAIASQSYGLSVRRSRISASTPFRASCFAATSERCTSAPKVTTVTSRPSRTTAALPNGIV